MPRLIDANRLAKDVEESVEDWSKWDILYLLENAPTVDAEPVIRCKDCIHYWKNKPSDDVPVCLASPKDDAFCSEGERREDD